MVNPRDMAENAKEKEDAGRQRKKDRERDRAGGRGGGTERDRQAET